MDVSETITSHYWKKILVMNLHKCYSRKDTGMFWYDPQGLHPITPIVRLIESRYVGKFGIELATKPALWHTRSLPQWVPRRSPEGLRFFITLSVCTWFFAGHDYIWGSHTTPGMKCEGMYVATRRVLAVQLVWKLISFINFQFKWPTCCSTQLWTCISSTLVNLKFQNF